MHAIEAMTDEPRNPNEYSGWANRETWVLNRWLSSDYGLYLATQNVVDETKQEYVEFCCSYQLDPTQSRQAFTVGEAILAWVDDEMKEWDWDDYSMMREDVGSLWRVDAQELGEAWTEEDEGEEEEERKRRKWRRREGEEGEREDALPRH